MAFSYDPSAASKARLIDEGEYQATIVGAEEKLSKSSGKPMVQITFDVWMPDNSTRKFWEYVTEGAIYKLKAIADAIGATDAFASGVFDPGTYLNQNLDIKIKHRADRQSGEMRANIVEFLPSSLGKAAPAKPAKVAAGVPADTTVTEDDIPF